MFTLANRFGRRPGAFPAVTPGTVTIGTAPPIDPVFSLLPDAVVHAEGDSGDTAYIFTVTRSANLTGAATVDYQVAGTGANPADADDFGGSFPAGALELPEGAETATITVLVSGDTEVEADEQFTLTISSPSTGSIANASAIGIITNDDSAAPSPVSIILPTAQWDSDFSATGDATGWPDGNYDTGIGVTVTIANGIYTATGTPA